MPVGLDRDIVPSEELKALSTMISDHVGWPLAFAL